MPRPDVPFHSPAQKLSFCESVICTFGQTNENESQIFIVFQGDTVKEVVLEIGNFSENSINPFMSIKEPRCL